MASTKRSDSYTFYHIPAGGGVARWIRVESNDEHPLQISTREDADDQFDYLALGTPAYLLALRAFVAHIIRRVKQE